MKQYIHAIQKHTKMVTLHNFPFRPKTECTICVGIAYTKSDELHQKKKQKTG